MNNFHLGFFIVLVILPIMICDKSIVPDIIQPEVTITYPIDGSRVSKIVTITAMATDNKGIEKLDLWVDGNLIEGSEDLTEPYEFKWNTVVYENGSAHTITVRAFDKSGNKSDSENIILIVDNLNTPPSKINLYPIIYENSSFLINWPASKDTDFHSYTLYEASSENMNDAVEIFKSYTQNDTSFTVANIPENIKRYYRLMVEDSAGLKTEGDIRAASSCIYIAYYPLDGNANDESLNNNHGQVFGATLTEDRFGNSDSAYRFDGIDDYISTPYFPSQELVTITVWIKFDKILSEFGQLLGTHDNTIHRLYLGIDEVGQFFCGVGDNWIGHEKESIDAGIDTNKWHFFSLVCDGSLAKVYLDGSEKISFSYNFRGKSASYFVIGARYYKSQVNHVPIQGTIDDVRIYNKALTAQEISDLFQQSE